MLLSAITALAALAGTALAQSQSSGTASAPPAASTAAIPTCAVTCLGTALPNSPCAQYGVSNITCICTSQQFQLAYFQCQQSSCSQSDLQAAEQYGAQVCQQNGTPIDVNATPSGYTSGASASATGSSSSSSMASAASSGSASASKPASTSAGASGASGSAASGSAPSSTSAPSSGAQKTSSSVMVGGVVGVVAAVMGVVVLA